jgi:hypothetical protein
MSWRNLILMTATAGSIDEGGCIKPLSSFRKADSCDKSLGQDGRSAGGGSQRDAAAEVSGLRHATSSASVR